MIGEAGSRLLVVGQEFIGVLDEMEADLASVEKILVVGGHPRHEAFEAWRDRQDAADPGARAGPDDTVLLLYSSGTTGAPKGVMTRNGGLFDLMRICSPIWGIGRDSITLVNMPMSTSEASAGERSLTTTAPPASSSGRTCRMGWSRS